MITFRPTPEDEQRIEEIKANYPWPAALTPMSTADVLRLAILELHTSTCAKKSKKRA